jgi:two-component sensor histidine kinase
VARFDELAAERTDLSEADLQHLRALVAEWTLIADLSFADLVLWLPTWHGGGFVAADQVRPTTGPTFLLDDVVGQYSPRGRQPLLDRAMATRAVAPPRSRAQVPAAQEAVAVTRERRVIAVLARHSAVSLRAVGKLETNYLAAADDLIAMVVDGSFPPAHPVPRTGTPPRVGDGIIRIDADGVVSFASPNARSAYHRLGLASDLVGLRLARTTARLARRPGPVDEELAGVTSGRLAGGAEVENDRAVVTLRGVPLFAQGEPAGALVLIRDATEIRSRDRALVGKDATIREIHHRVKNNLQTVAALLRLQARRLDSPDARAALDQAVRRVGAIAVVHDSLARSADERVDADEIVDRLVGLVAEMAPGGAVLVRDGSIGELAPEVVTPLAMALGELLQNAAEHGGRAGHRPRIEVAARRTGGSVTVTVTDDGPGIDPDCDPFDTGRLGLQIVRTLVTEELGGSLALGPAADGGTRAVVTVPTAPGTAATGAR